VPCHARHAWPGDALLQVRRLGLHRPDHVHPRLQVRRAQRVPLDVRPGQEGAARDAQGVDDVPAGPGPDVRQGVPDVRWQDVHGAEVLQERSRVLRDVGHVAVAVPFAAAQDGGARAVRAVRWHRLHGPDQVRRRVQVHVRRARGAVQAVPPDAPVRRLSTMDGGCLSGSPPTANTVV